MNYIKPKPTKYNSILYKSRLEAKWAVFFDKLGINAIYEPVTSTYNGYKYTPDFYLISKVVFEPNMTHSGILVEIKPTEPTEEYIDFVNNMIDFDKTDFILCVGEPNSKQPLGYHFSKNGFYKGFDFPSINANNYQQAREQAISYRFDLK